MSDLSLLYQKYGTYHILYQQLNPPSPSVGFAWRKTKDQLFHEAKNKICTLIKNNKQIKIADVGCGNGGFLLRLAVEVNNPLIIFYGYDISTPFVEFANKAAKFKKLDNVEFTKLDIENQNLPHKFDLIISSELLEHLVHPETFINKIHTFLTSGGYFLLTTPNRNNWIKYPFWFLKSSTHKMQQAEFSKSLTPEEEILLLAEHEQHLYVYTHNELSRLLDKHGFIVYKVKRSSLVFGGPVLDNHPLFLGLTIVIDWLFDMLPFPQVGWDIIIFSQKNPQ